MKKKPEELINKVNILRAERATWENHWQEIATYILPDQWVTNQRQAGTKTNTTLYDNTAMQANMLLSSALHGMLTNAAVNWFEYTTGDEDLDQDDDIRLWLQDAARRTHNVLNNSNFQTEVATMYRSLTAFGTAPFLVEEDDKFIVRFSARPIREIFIEENNLGLVDCMYRRFPWKAKQIIEEFGEKVVPNKVLSCYQRGDPRDFYLIHAIYPDTSPKGSFKYFSQTILEEDKQELRTKGFREFPYVVPRWGKEAGEDYGRSPSMVALPEAKTMNKMVEQELIAAAKIIDPPLMLPDDGFMLPIRTRPGGQNYYRSGTQDRIEPIYKDIRLDFSYQESEQRRMRIREAYFIDQLQLSNGPQMTATEVLQRTEEKLRLLGPMLGRLQHEFLRPMIDRVFAIMWRRNLLKSPPELLLETTGGKIDVRYSSPIARTQRTSEGLAIARTLQAVAPFAEADPSVLDNFDGDVAVREVAGIYSFPQKIIRPRQKVVEMREQKAQAQAQMVQAQQEAQAADVTNKNAQAMGQLKMASNQG